MSRILCWILHAHRSGLGRLRRDNCAPRSKISCPKAQHRQRRVSAIEAGLRSPMGESVRETMARWIVDEVVPVDGLVPEA